MKGIDKNFFFITYKEGDFKIPLTPFVKGGKKGMEPVNFVIVIVAGSHSHKAETSSPIGRRSAP